MQRSFWGTGHTLLTAVVIVALAWDAAATPAQRAAELDTRRLVGKAHYENDEYDQASEQFRRCIELAPASAIDHFNLALTRLRAQDYDEALAALDKAERADPKLLAVQYARGIIYKRQGEFDRAVVALQRVLARDPSCGGAFYNLGVSFKALAKHQEARAAFLGKLKLTPDDPSTHYQLMGLYRRIGDVENAERHQEIFLRVQDTVDDSEKTMEAVERSTYSYIIDAPRLTPDLTPRLDSRARFVDVTARAGLAQAKTSKRDQQRRGGSAATPERHACSVGGAVALADYDQDGDQDIYVVRCSTDTKAAANSLYQNRGDGTFADVAAAAGVAHPGLGTGAVFGDYNNDGHIDLYVVNYGANALYRAKGDGTFEDVSRSARANEPNSGRRVLFVDYDHDNDVDLFIANDVDFTPPRKRLTRARRFPQDFEGQANTLLRNNGNGTFSDQSDAAGLLEGFEQTRDLLFADFDDDYDTDLVIVNADARPKLFTNTRFGRFTPGGKLNPPLPKSTAAVAAGDFTHDGRTDLVFATPDGLRLYANTHAAGKGRFALVPGALPKKLPGGVERLGTLDYNNDGWTDLLVAGSGGAAPRLLAGAGPNAFYEVSKSAGLTGSFGEIADLAAADLDGDGDEDVVLQTRDRGPVLLSNEGGSRAGWLGVRLLGQKSNKGGYGASVEVAAGGHYQKQTYRRDGLHFGLGDLEAVDVLRVTWPNGVAQNVLHPAVGARLVVKEHVKVSASCAFLFGYNGDGFELINEILGIGPLGVPKAPGAYHDPDSTELTKIESHELVAKDGFYELRLTEELRELVYADQITLRVVDHPAGLEVIPNEKFVAPPFPEDKLFAVAEHRPPRAAVDDRGSDVLALVLEHDGRYPTFPLTPYDGLAQPHSLTLDLGELAGAQEVMLYLDGWIYWPESSTVMAISQDPRFAVAPLRLEVRDCSGKWITAVESVGLPTSKGLVVPVDLSGRFPCDDYHIRLSTTLSVYFDRVFTATRNDASQCQVTELSPAEAELRYRGFSAMTRDELGYERFDYARASSTGSWSPPRGFLTRYGDVVSLLEQPDDMFVIFGPGDELRLRFATKTLPELPDGWVRDFVFYASGWVKDGDLNTKYSETVEPLPFHAMSAYPYPETESYPQTAELQRYRRTYNTRPSRSTVGPLAGEP